MFFLKNINTREKKIISFSLWGEDSKYYVGAEKNVLLAKKIYPGWICRFYVNKDSFEKNDEFIKKLIKHDNVEIVIVDESADWLGLFWRFYPCSDKDVSIMISRDCDSRLSKREKISVKMWLKSSKKFHIMRDHPNHNFKILGGMWGVKCFDEIRNMKKLIEEYKKENRFNIDQEFLENIIYPYAILEASISDPFFEKKPFPTLRLNWNFVGNVYDENDIPNIEYIQQLKKYYSGKKIHMFFLWMKFKIKTILDW